MDIVIAILLILIFAQGFLVVRKKNKISHKEHLNKADELISYTQQRNEDLTDEDGKNALMIACSNHYYKKNSSERDYLDVIKSAINNNFDLNKRCLKEGKTALFYAVKNEKKEYVDTLLAANADVNITDNNNRIVLFDAVKMHSRYNSIVNLTHDINHQDSLGVNSLMIASYKMHFKIIEDLLARGANAKLRNHAGENSYDIAKKYIGSHIRVAIETQSGDESGKSNNITTKKDVLNAQKHNHRVRELVRRLQCIVNDEEYIPKKFKKPFLNTGKAN